MFPIFSIEFYQSFIAKYEYKLQFLILSLGNEKRNLWEVPRSERKYCRIGRWSKEYKFASAEVRM